MYHSFWIHSFADGHLGCFQYLAIVNCVALNIGVHGLFWVGVSGLLGVILPVELLGPKAILFLVFWGNSILLCLMVAPVCNPTNSSFRFHFLHILSNTCWLLLCLTTILTGVSWYFIVVLICISLMASDAEHLFICLWALCIFSVEKCLFKSFAHFLIGLFVFLEWSSVSSL